MVSQGEIYWLNLSPPTGSEPGCHRPHVVVQNNIFNHSRINTVIACGITSNLARAGLPGQVLVPAGEGNLPRDSVVNATQVITIDKRRLTQPIGRLSPERMREILDAIRVVLEPAQP
jgi:mRNA interferase MazF